MGGAAILLVFSHVAFLLFGSITKKLSVSISQNAPKKVFHTKGLKPLASVHAIVRTSSTMLAVCCGSCMGLEA